jgi:hypothetical protein
MSVATVDLRNPTIFEADLPGLCYDDAPTPDEAHRRIGIAARQGGVAMGPHGPEILGYELVRATLRDHRLAPPPGLGLEAQGILSGPLWDRMSTTLLSINGADHARMRRLVSKAFTPRAVARLDGTITAIINELIDPIAASGRCDVVADIARPYPVPVICELLGAPRGDWQLFSAWADAFFKAFTFNVAEYEDEILTGWAELDDYVDGMVAERRRSLTDDLLSEMIRAEDDGDRLSADELRMLAGGILMAGTDTTRNQVAAAVDVFCDHPEQWELLAQRPELAMNAVEEVMRFYPRRVRRHADDDRGFRGRGGRHPDRHLRSGQHGVGQPRPPRVRRAGPLRHHPRGCGADADLRRGGALLPGRQLGPSRARGSPRRDVAPDAQHPPRGTRGVEAVGRHHRARRAARRVRRTSLSIRTVLAACVHTLRACVRCSMTCWMSGGPVA